MLRRLARGSILGLLPLVLACGGASVPPDRPADVRGAVTSLRPADAPAASERDLLGWALIEGPRDAGTQIDRAMVTITRSTGIYRQQGSAREPVTFTALAIGQRVEVWLTGPVRESYPIQATASDVVIVDGG